MNRPLPTHVALAVAGAILGPDAVHRALCAGLPYRACVTSALPHDDERMKKAHARRERRQAARPNARISPPS